MKANLKELYELRDLAVDHKLGDMTRLLNQIIYDLSIAGTAIIKLDKGLLESLKESI